MDANTHPPFRLFQTLKRYTAFSIIQALKIVA